MRPLFPLLFVFFPAGTFLVACNQHTEATQNLQQEVDSLRLRMNSLYKPGMGELMSNIQLHHGKLWFAGENKNWPLAKGALSF